MAASALPFPQKIHDHELSEWLARSNAEERELIVEAAVPSRKVSFRKRADGRMLPAAVGGSEARTAVLEELRSYLQGLLATPPTLLKAAGALAVRASGSEAQALLEHPLVKSLRLNRKLHPPLKRTAPKTSRAGACASAIPARS